MDPPEVFLIGNFHVQWADGHLVIEDEDELRAFTSPAEGPLFSISVSEVEVEYGSGSFTFEEGEVETCSGRELVPAMWGDDTVSFTGAFSNCPGGVELGFQDRGDGTLGWSLRSLETSDRVTLRGRSVASERFVGFGAQYDGLNMKGRQLPIWCQEQGHGRGAEPLTSFLSTQPGNPAGDWHTSYTCVPWTLTDRDRGLFVDNTERVVFDFSEDDAFSVTAWAGSMAGGMVTGADPATLVERYTAQVGRMVSLPDWSQEGVIIRAHGGADDVRETVHEAKTAGIKVAAVWVEDWCGIRDTVLGSRMWWNWQVDRTQYPDWEVMVAQLERDGVRVLAYMNPYLTDAADQPGVGRNLYAEADANDFLVRTEDDEVFLMDQVGFFAGLVDLTNPEAVDWLQGVVEDMLSTGVSGWMADFSEGLPLDVVLAEGVAETAHNRWPEWWAQINKDALEEAGKMEDSLVFHRSGNAMSPGLARSFWLGDQTVSWDAQDGLATVIPALISSGLSGYSMQHADTGGYLSQAFLDLVRDEELFRRWVELNAFTPLIRMHSTNQPDENHQWNTNAATTAHLERMSGVFEGLADYRSSLMADAEVRGLPLIRPLFFHFPEDDVAWSIVDQFLLGADLLVAPVVSPGAEARDVYLPEGEWQHGPSGVVYVGPDWVRVSAPVGSPAVFGRAETDAARTVVDRLHSRR